jgi:tetratricopeptide (TPR) repeat protein
MKSVNTLRLKLVICVGLVVAILIVYWQATHHEFVSFDDGLYVADNQMVQAGITLDGIRWAFGFTDIAYWHPLTWLSHMLDYQFFGLDSGKHHLTNLIFHMASSLLLFFVGVRMTGQLGPSVFVAALFAVHPINVESVAWVAERKNVLSTFFWMLTLLSYAAYAQKPSRVRYSLTLVTFACGLMVKPALITMPFIFLLLDFWPLRRMRIPPAIDAGADQTAVLPESPKKEIDLRLLILEKIPFFVLAGICITLTMASVKHHGIVVSANEAQTYLRVANAAITYVSYIAKLFWPSKLAVFYPYPTAIPVWYAVAAFIWLACISTITLRYWRQLPFLIVGWLWYLGTLVPHLGFVQAGIWPAMADRWAYVPFVGLFIMLGWAIPEIRSRFKWRQTALAAGGGIVVCVFMAVSWIQVGYWQNSIRLYQRAVDVTANNDVAHNNLGVAFFEASRIDKAIYHFVRAIQIMPGLAAGYDNLNRALAAHRNIDAAITEMHRLIELYPTTAGLKYNLGNLYRKKGQFDNAIDYYNRALSYKPNFIQAINNLAAVYVLKEDYTKALPLLNKILEIEPNAFDVSYTIASIYARQNDVDDAARWLKKAVDSGFNDWNLLKSDSGFDNIRNSVYYTELIQKH